MRVLLLWSCLIASAAAQEAADLAFAEGRFVEAEQLYADALATPNQDATVLVQSHLRIGVLRALAADDTAALTHFDIALALDPLLEAPSELSAELRARFEALRAARDGRRLSVRIEEQDGLRLAIVHDAPEGLVAALRLRGQGDLERRFVFRGAPIEIHVAPAAEPISIEALDAQDQVLARAGARPIQAAVDLRAPPPTSNLLESPWFWVVAGVIVVAVAIAIGVSASGDRWTIGVPILR